MTYLLTYLLTYLYNAILLPFAIKSEAYITLSSMQLSKYTRKTFLRSTTVTGAK